MRGMTRTLLFLLVGAWWSGCAQEANDNRGNLPPWKQSETPPDEPLGTLTAALSMAEDCDDAMAALKEKLIAQMEERLEQSYHQVLEQLEYGCYMYMEDGMPGGYADASAAQDAGSGGTDEEEASEYSTTNTQVADLDEADFIKNDGGHLYVLADGKLRIFDAWPAPEAHLVSATEIRGTPTRLFVHKDRAVVYSSLEPIEVQQDYGYEYYPEALYHECTYGYDCEFTGDGRALFVTVLDLTDLAKPSLEREILFTGSYLNSRRIDDTIYAVVYFPDLIAALPGVFYTPEAFRAWDWCEDPDAWTTDMVDAAFAALFEANLALIQAADLSEQLPQVRDTRYVDGHAQSDGTLLADCAGFYVDPAGDGAALLSLVSFDLLAGEPLAATTVVGKPGAVYASREALYVATRHSAYGMSSWYYEEDAGIEEATTFHKFALSAHDVSTAYAGSGVAKGRILNQFSMDEQRGYLRVATTTGHLPGPAYNTLSVMEDKGEGLEVLGVLKIPGFSTYMHMIDSRHVLAMGYDADDQGDFAWFQGIQLQIFDVSDLAHPTVMHKETIGTRGSTSEAATNHLAFTFFGARDLLAVPMTICEGGGGGSYGDLMTFSGLLVYRVTLDEGFRKLGGVPHQAPETPQDYWGACGNWWTDSHSLVQRSVFLEDWVFSVAPDQIKVASIDDLSHPVATLPLTEGE